ncbi:MAG TPA: hypothetical protein VLK82_15365 [Candidatus Tectomicrobia bacterium]|nr:hypothetical protein [Candidatus Tectomicrobia bacterium]
MTFLTRSRGPIEELFGVGRLPAIFSEGCWWADRRAIASLYIDLEQDDYQEIARKLERWENLEAQAK